MVGCLERCVSAWQEIGAGAVVLDIVSKGLQLTLLGALEEDKGYCLLPFKGEMVWLAAELGRLVVAQVIEWMGNGLTCWHNTWDGCRRPPRASGSHLNWSR